MIFWSKISTSFENCPKIFLKIKFFFYTFSRSDKINKFVDILTNYVMRQKVTIKINKKFSSPVERARFSSSKSKISKWKKNSYFWLTVACFLNFLYDIFKIQLLHERFLRYGQKSKTVLPGWKISSFNHLFFGRKYS